MAYDANLLLASNVTSTVTTANTAFNLLTGTPRRGMVAKVFYSNAANGSGANNVYFSIEQSQDNVNWYPLAFQLENPAGGGTSGIALSTTSQGGEAHVHFDISNQQATALQSQYIRLKCNIAGAGTVPTITYTSYLGTARP